jgi:hypothetical protein
MSTVIKYITSGGLYVLFGAWSFFQVLEYKYYTRVEQYDTIVENMKICKQKYGELLLKMRQLENRVDELEDILLEHNLEGELEEETLSLDFEALKKAELEEASSAAIVEEALSAVTNEIVVEEEISAAIVKEELSAATNEIVVDEELSEVTNEIVVEEELEEELEEEELSAAIVESVASLEDEMVDISEETYPIKNQAQNKKGWLKTILFL